MCRSSSKKTKKAAPPVRRRAKSQPAAPEDGGTGAALVSIIRKGMKGKDQRRVGLLSEGGVDLPEITEWISTGFPNLDYTFGGGYPVGRVTECFGVEASGKSAMMHYGLKTCQDAGGTAVLFDFEQDLNQQERIEKMGIDRSRLVYCNPLHVEEGLRMLRDIIGELRKKPPKAPTFIGWDSIAFSRTAEQVKDPDTDQHSAYLAKLLSRWLQWLMYEAPKARVHVMFINQVRDRVGASRFMDPEKTPGGHALKFAATLRLRCTGRQIWEDVDRKRRSVGVESSVRTVKNKSAPPFQTTSWILDYEHGPSPGLTIRKLLLDARVLTVARAGGYYKVPFWEKVFRRSEWLDLMQDAQFAANARQSVLEYMERGQKPV